METSNFLIANTHKNINHFEKIEELIKNSKQDRIICPFISERSECFQIFDTCQQYCTNTLDGLDTNEIREVGHIFVA